MNIGFRIIEHTQHHIRYFSSVFPETKTTRCHYFIWPHGSSDEMKARKQMHKQVSRNARAIITVVSPAKKTGGIESTLICVGNKGVPINCLWGGIGRDRVLPRTLRRHPCPKTLG